MATYRFSVHRHAFAGTTEQCLPVLKLEIDRKSLVTSWERSIDHNTNIQASWLIALRRQLRRSIVTLELDCTYLNPSLNESVNTNDRPIGTPLTSI